MSATRLLRDLKACLLQKDFQDDFNPLVVKYMHLKEKKERLRLLENFFTLDSHPHSYHGEYDGCELLLHLVEEAMSFAVEHGLSGHGVFHFLSLFISCLDFLVGSHRVTPGSTVFPYPGFPLRWKMNLTPKMMTALRYFKDKTIPIYHSGHFSRSFLMSSTEFILKSIFQHFNLYQYLLRQPQMCTSSSLHYNIEAPWEAPPKLSDGTPELEWIRAKRKEELEVEYSGKAAELEAASTAVISKAKTRMEDILRDKLAAFHDGSKRVPVKEVADIIAELAKAHLGLVEVVLSQNILRGELDLSHRLEILWSLLPPAKKLVHSKHLKQLQYKESGLKAEIPAFKPFLTPHDESSKHETSTRVHRQRRESILHIGRLSRLPSEQSDASRSSPRQHKQSIAQSDNRVSSNKPDSRRQRRESGYNVQFSSQLSSKASSKQRRETISSSKKQDQRLNTQPFKESSAVRQDTKSLSPKLQSVGPSFSAVETLKPSSPKEQRLSSAPSSNEKTRDRSLKGGL